MREERYHYANESVAICEKSACTLEHHSIDEAFDLLAGDVLGDRYLYQPRHRREVVA